MSLVGWALGVRWMQGLFPGAAPLNPGSALCFLLLGLAQFWVRAPENQPWRRLAAAARVIPAVAVALLAGLRLAESLGTAAVASEAEAALSPARAFISGMSSNAALCFLLLGLALTIFDVRAGRRLEYSQLLFLVESTLALGAFLLPLHSSDGLGEFLS